MTIEFEFDYNQVVNGNYESVPTFDSLIDGMQKTQQRKENNLHYVCNLSSLFDLKVLIRLYFGEEVS